MSHRLFTTERPCERRREHRLQSKDQRDLHGSGDSLGRHLGQESQQSRHVYKDIQAEVYPLPEGVKQALPGLLNDNIYIYREIAPTLNLVAYLPGYNLQKAPTIAAQAFLALADEPE